MTSSESDDSEFSSDGWEKFESSSQGDSLSSEDYDDLKKHR